MKKFISLVTLLCLLCFPMLANAQATFRIDQKTEITAFDDITADIVLIEIKPDDSTDRAYRKMTAYNFLGFNLKDMRELADPGADRILFWDDSDTADEWNFLTLGTGLSISGTTLSLSGIDATDIADGSVTSTEFQYLGSVTSDIQTQLDALLGDLTDDTTPQLGGHLDLNDKYIYEAWNTLTDGDATPDVSAGTNFKMVDGDTTETEITDFDGSPVDGQCFKLVAVDDPSYIEIKFSSGNINGNGGSDYVMEFGDVLEFCYESASGDWNLVGGISGSGSGDVTAASSFGTDNRAIRSDGTGKGVQASSVTIGDDGSVTVPGGVTTSAAGTGTIDIYDSGHDHYARFTITGDWAASRTFTFPEPSGNVTPVIAHNGTAGNDYVIETEFIPVGWMIADGVTDPGDLTEEDNIAYRDFDDAAAEELEFMWHAPLDLTGSTVKVQVVMLITNAVPPPDTFGVSWGIAACSITGDDSHDCAVGAEINCEDTDLDNHAGAQWDIVYLGSEAVDDPSAAAGWVELTPTGLAKAELVKFAIQRDVADADDDYAQDVGLVGVIIKYKRQLDNNF